MNRVCNSLCVSQSPLLTRSPATVNHRSHSFVLPVSYDMMEDTIAYGQMDGWTAVNCIMQNYDYVLYQRLAIRQALNFISYLGIHLISQSHTKVTTKYI